MKAVIIGRKDKKNQEISYFFEEYDIKLKAISLESDDIETVKNSDIVILFGSKSFIIPLANKIKSLTTSAMIIAERPSSTSEALYYLNCGIDDLIPSDGDITESLIRIKNAAHRRLEAVRRASHDAIKSSVRLSYDTRSILSYGRRIKLTKKEMAVFSLLAQNHESMASRDDILAHIYNGRHVPESGRRIVDVFICHIRRKLAEAKVPIGIECKHAEGYYLELSGIPLEADVASGMPDINQEQHVGLAA